jgi:protein O-GlcNAc transferase
MCGVACAQINAHDEAISHLQRAVDLKPDYVEALSSLGAIYVIQNRLDDAIACLQKANAIEPTSIQVLYNLGGALKRKGRLEEAIACYKQAISIAPNYVQAYNKCGEVLAEDNQITEAITYFQRTLILQRDHPIANRLYNLVLPVIYECEENIDDWRDRFVAGLSKYIDLYDLEIEESRKLALAGISYCANFYLTYQAQNDLQLQRQYAEFVHRIMAANYPQWMQNLDMPPLGVDARIRIGYLSPNLKNHAGVAWSLGWLKHRDRTKFEVYSYFTGKSPDEATELFSAESDYFRHIHDGFEAICEQVYADRLHILVFPDIGMDAQSLKLAVLRLAPIQCACWGHPITSGSPNIEYFLSGDLMEPDNAQSHYSETLVRLPKLGFCYPKPQFPQGRKTRADFQIPEDAIVYLACQSFYKYLPQHDYIFAEIARRMPRAKFVFICRYSPHIHQQFHQRLERAFSQVGLDVDNFCVMLPRQNGDDYINLHLVSDIFLDSIGWSGGNTSLEAIAAGLAVVTLPGEFMRGRHTYAMLKILEMQDTIAQDEAEYIDIAVRLAADPDWRHRIVERMRSRHDRLYEDTTCVRALEEFYQAAINPQSQDELLKSAIAHHQVGRWAEAQQIYQQILWRDPKECNALYLSGAIAYHSGDQEAAKKYFRQTIAVRSDHAEAHKRLGDISLEQGDTDEAIMAYQQAIVSKPNYVDARYNLGNLQWQAGNFPQAAIHYRQVITLNPSFAEAHSNLGSTLYAEGKITEAIASLQTAIAINPNYAEANYNLGTLLFKQGNINAAKPYLEQAIAINPQSAEAHNVLGNVLREQGNLSDAIDSYMQAIAINPNYAEAHRNLGTAQLTRGNLRQGFSEYEWRWQMPLALENPLPLTQPLWDGSNLGGDRILIYSEQGYGDTIQFIRYISLVKACGGQVIFACPQPLIGLLKTVKDIQLLVDTYDRLPQVSYRIPLMSLPHIFGTDLASIPAQVPYLSPPIQPTPPIYPTHPNQKLEPPKTGQKRVGLVWASKPGHFTANKRSCPFAILQSLLELQEISFYSLQKDIPTAESDLFHTQREAIVDLRDRINDFSDTARLIDQMDLVISVDTAVAHLAGALGKPVWVMLPFVSDWRWLLEREDSPWYPTMRLFRQQQIGDWEGVIQRVKIALRNWREYRH